MYSQLDFDKITKNVCFLSYEQVCIQMTVIIIKIDGWYSADIYLKALLLSDFLSTVNCSDFYWTVNEFLT